MKFVYYFCGREYPHDMHLWNHPETGIETCTGWEDE